MNTDIFDYTELDNQIIITGLKNDTIETSIIIPKKINGKPVTQIAERAFKKSHITGVQIGENIKNIELAAFEDCKELVSVVYKAHCKIPNSCFCNCTNLSEFDFAHVEVIDQAAFVASGLTKVYLPNNIKKIEGEAFRNCEKLSSVDWHAQCDIPELCFAYCLKLSTFNFDNIAAIGNDAFMYSGLTEVILPYNIEKIGLGTFRYCNELSSVIWNAQCGISFECFFNCSKLVKFDFANVETIGEFAFSGSGLEKVDLLQNIRKIEPLVFFQCNKLMSVTWYAQCGIPERCFANCSKLNTFDFAYVQNIGKYAFTSSGLKEIYLADNVKEIEEGAFRSCHNLKKVEWNADCSIHDYVFEKCQKLKEVIISDKVCSIETDAFKDCPNIEIAFV